MAPRIAKKNPRASRPGGRSGDTGDTGDTGGAERLQKVLAAAGLGSRRQCETMIEEGRVEVDRRVVTQLGTKVEPHRQEVRVDGEPLPQPRLVYYAVHKPAGVVSTSRDPAGRPRIIDLVPPSAGRLFSIGRLDMSSEGLILLTNDGELSNRLTHPRYGVDKTYLVQVAGHPDYDVLKTLRRGVHLAEGFAHAESARIKSRRKQSAILEMVLDEGRNREIRRLLARVGHKVQRLTRVAVGPVRLGDLPAGAYRELTRDEVRDLKKAAYAGRTKEEGEPASPRGKPSRRPAKSPAKSPGKRAAKSRSGKQARKVRG